MSSLYACIAGGGNKKELVSVAEQFAYSIELLEDAVLFDITGTEKLFGAPAQIAGRIYEELRIRKLPGNVSVAANAAAALLHARNQNGISIVDENTASDLPLAALDIDPDTLEVFHALGFKNKSDLSGIPESELLDRYGPEFKETVDLAKNQGIYILTPNLKENKLTWSSQYDFRVDNFEQLVFILSNGLDKTLAKIAYYGFSTEHIDITLGLGNRTAKSYKIKLSFPTRDKKFWLTIVNLRIANDPPEAEIVSITLTAHFTRPRNVQLGLLASARPEPESLQLTADKIKNLIGEENVGVPVLLDRRLPKAFTLDSDKLPLGRENLEPADPKPVLTLNYFEPPLAAEVLFDKNSLLYLKTQYFGGTVKEYGGVWKGSSQWWSLLGWRTQEWDVELEDLSLYRLQRNGRGWLVIGKYD